MMLRAAYAVVMLQHPTELCDGELHGVHNILALVRVKRAPGLPPSSYIRLWFINLPNDAVEFVPSLGMDWIPLDYRPSACTQISLPFSFLQGQ